VSGLHREDEGRDGGKTAQTICEHGNVPTTDERKGIMIAAPPARNRA
jgi:hypothetical protein